MSAPPVPLPPSPLDDWPPAWEPVAVVFDCDGLLLDTESRWVEMQQQYLAAHGASFDPATRRSITGRPATVVVTAIAELIGKDPLVVGEELLERYRATLGTGEQPLPGAMETVRAVAARKPVAIASNSPREMLDRKLASAGLYDLVDASIAVEDVIDPKPAPDMYLEGARRLGGAPADCLAFEDSETGAQAARDAGLQLIVVPSVPGQEPPAPRTIASLDDPVLAAWIASWEHSR
jgi:HAD superfamily hydrolase (TIGR01509 family)